jgi:hypothetical protein
MADTGCNTTSAPPPAPPVVHYYCGGIGRAVCGEPLSLDNTGPCFSTRYPDTTCAACRRACPPDPSPSAAAPTHSDRCIGRVHDSLGCSCGLASPSAAGAPEPRPPSEPTRDEVTRLFVDGWRAGMEQAIRECLYHVDKDRIMAALGAPPARPSSEPGDRARMCEACGRFPGKTIRHTALGARDGLGARDTLLCADCLMEHEVEEQASAPASSPAPEPQCVCGHAHAGYCPEKDCMCPHCPGRAAPSPTTEKEGRATVSDRLEAAIGAADRLRGRLAAPDRFDCLRCGIGVKADEDGLCAHCGIEVVIVRGGVPDYRAVAVVFEEAATAPAPSSPPGDAPTEEQIAELEALMAQAWPAPWTARTFEIDCPCPNGEHCGDSHTCEEVEAPEAYPASPAAPAAEGEGQCVVQISVPGLESLAGPNARFIATARNLLPSLIAALRAARASGPDADTNADMIRLIREITDANGAAGVPFLDDAVNVAIERASGGVRERVEALRAAEELLAFHEGSATPVRPGGNLAVTINANDFAAILAGVRAALGETKDDGSKGGTP